MAQKATPSVQKAISFAVILLVTCPLLWAVEKYWIAHEAQLILVGTLRPGLTFPWFDGWHVTGTITVDEVLYGERPAGQINYLFRCDCCPYWPPPRFTSEFTKKGLWFLRRTDAKTWESPFGCHDGGFRRLSERPDFEDYIRRYKSLNPPPK